MPVFLNGFTLCLALIVVIGAQNGVILRQGLKREYVLPLVTFCIVVDVALTAIGVFGISLALDQNSSAMTVVKLVGALFIGGYGVTALRRVFTSMQLDIGDTGQSERFLPIFLQLVSFTLLNPHVYLDTVMLIGSVGASYPITEKFWFIGGVGSASTLWFVALGYGSRILTPLFRSDKSWKILDAMVGFTMLVLSLSLVYSVVEKY